ncbi:uncharacterized protein LOC101454797 isoform X2 [Ceratitis capitata]|uniref:uncharacterized protein LOC101454797 isoform X2 n=1 Tax=Ceratitis capitata TaxID=7213 RepID=UPI000A0FBD12|nr:uncharacterized protein LOC101454797 isoform X2 [Ceratitis capitata]
MHFHSIFSLLKKEISKIRMPHKQKVFIGALVVLSSVLSLNAHPMYDGPSPAVLLKDMPRTQRQVVQPTWLVDKRRPATPSEANVRITAQNLQEAAELREEIRKAVEEGRFAVDVEQVSTGKSKKGILPHSLRREIFSHNRCRSHWVHSHPINLNGHFRGYPWNSFGHNSHNPT